MDWSDNGMAKVGASGGAVRSPDIARFVAGCMTRERERVARILEKHGFSPGAISEIRSGVDDEKVFKWAPPTGKLDDPPPTKK